jgi:hypothetical protein
MALVLYQDESSGEWTIIAAARSCAMRGGRTLARLLFQADRPPTIYFEFRARRGQWVQVPVSSQSIGRKTNLLTWYQWIFSTHVTVPEKEGFLRTRAGTSMREPYLGILEAYGGGFDHCRNEYTRAVQESEDGILESLERDGATPEQRLRVEELLAGTRLVYVRGVNLTNYFMWKPDSDPLTVQTVDGTFLNDRKAGVSADGQVIYIGTGMMRDKVRQLRDSYARRLQAAGLGAFGPAPVQPAAP